MDSIHFMLGMHGSLFEDGNMRAIRRRPIQQPSEYPEEHNAHKRE
jgi:hypothetical protein